jgi:hypothetical protein
MHLIPEEGKLKLSFSQSTIKMAVTPALLGKSPVNFFNIDPIAGGG